ncbi:DUF3305 domain-containing protein [Grimontia hollisae]|nr:DUF3305 domain-containing protein [Grimontia hollisae]AMG29682.1 DUF3305 domain-containing protein [Grimontia hollisae]MDF2184248.1 DUF3305 domain-containing protein [Grimontia hollisae]STO43609.1 Protein of uncharacterised function (DUF3305) [Grimontia hollisae]STO57023.1 Protein of uncharacterised function (DUF3305) [Grimontia hollisae]STQ74885.1 Protein of uncharacterised function (DUF3305) [Grimontia hollisae]
MTRIIKDPNCWLIQFDLESTDVAIGRWKTKRWSIVNLNFPKTEDECSDSQISLPLELFKDERTDYRFNLSSRDPHLFFIFEVEEDESLNPLQVTASQSNAASFMDGDYLVQSVPMPLTVQAWMEAFIGRHGELLEVRKKKRKGAGRSNGN